MAKITRRVSRDPDDVEQIWKQFVPTASLLQIDPEDFSFRWQSVELADVSIIRYSLTATVQSRVQPDDQLFSCRLTAPSGWIRTRRDEIENGMPWATDGTQVEARWEGTAEVSALAFERTRAEALARRITGDDLLSLRLTSTLPRDPAAAQHWVRAFDYLMTSAVAAEGDEIIEAALARHALVTILSCFPSTYSDAITRSVSSPGTETVRRALAFIDERAHTPITIDDVAEAAHVSTRGLQYAFRSSLNLTPTEYLRRVRLDGAHRELRNAGGSATVAQIARRWGFGNPSRFNTLYRQTYGRTAKSTLEEG